MSFASRLNATGTHARSTVTKDAVGGSVNTYGAVTTFSCAVWPTSSSLMKLFSQETINTEFVIATNTDLGADERDKITVSGVDYLVGGTSLFSNPNFSATTVYLLFVNRKSR